ncbi:MAG: LssY C-terminal domain-containing protein [Bryobacterales bacterium]|nr:LssY C-terminal domain-containing protein [Bryobacterales bacterium]
MIQFWAYLWIGTCGLDAAEVPAGAVLSVRLIESVASDGNLVEDSVRGMLAAPFEVSRGLQIPARTPVEGRVASSRTVGYGWRRERAALEIEFDALVLVDGTRIAIEGKVVELENAREKVNREGIIAGTLAAGAPHLFYNGRLKGLPVLNPLTDPILLIHKATFPFFPQPEIRLPRGADLQLRITVPFQFPDRELQAVEAERGALPELLAAKPARIETKGGQGSDLINLAFAGTEGELVRAFDSAGWNTANKANWRSVFRGMRDLFEQSFDPHAPMSRMLWEGRAPDFQFQKSLNSYAKRHHVRIWRAGWMADGTPLWAGAATHDVQLKFAWRKLHFTHGIASDIDKERQKVHHDLSFAGCVESSALWDRDLPGVLRNSDRTPMFTDGAIQLLDLQTCRHKRIGTAEEHIQMTRADKPLLQRYLRRQVLVLRNDILRANVFYGLGDLSRRLVRGVIHWNHQRGVLARQRGIARKAEVASALR